MVEQLFEFTQHVIYGDNKSSTIDEARAANWGKMKNKSFIRLPPDADSLLGICNAPPVPEAPHIATRTWLGGGGWSLPTRDLLSRRTYLHQAQHKSAWKMTVRRRMREIMMYRGGGGIYLNLMIQNVVRQIRADHMSQCHIDSSATMA